MKERGTAILMLTKLIPKWSFILSKFIATSVLVLSTMILAYGICLFYTFFFSKMRLRSQHRRLSGGCLLSDHCRHIIFQHHQPFSGLIRCVLSRRLLLSYSAMLHKSLATYSPGALPTFMDKIRWPNCHFWRAVPADYHPRFCGSAVDSDRANL